MKARFLSYTFAAVGCGLLGCELFTTRSPEQPAPGPTGGWMVPRTPRIVLQNLASSIGRRSTLDYVRCLLESDSLNKGFSFQPDPKTAANLPGYFDNWGLEKERAHAQALFSPTTLPTDSVALMEFTVDRETLLGDSATITAAYQLHIGHLVTTAPRLMSGRLEFSLSRGLNGEWHIYRWEDNRVDEGPCWSDLKAQVL